MPTEFSEHIKSGLQQLKRKAQERDLWGRRAELRRCLKARLFEAGFQHAIWSEDSGTYFQVGQAGGGFTGDTEDLEPENERDINLYLGYAKSFYSVFCQNTPNPKFQPEDPTSPEDITAADEADKQRRVIEKNNPPNAAQRAIARYLWTDGVVVGRVFYEKEAEAHGEARGQSGAELSDQEEEADSSAEPRNDNFTGSESDGHLRHGTGNGVPGADSGEPEGSGVEEDEDTAEGGATQDLASEQDRFPGVERIEYWGALECKRPLSVKDRKKWPYFGISHEEDISTCKGRWKDVEDNITGKSSPIGTEARARLARIAVSQGAGGFTGGGMTLPYLATIDEYWFRPDFYSEIGPKTDTARQELEKEFPDGVRYVSIGDTFCEAEPESMDAAIREMKVLEADGSVVPGLGHPAVDPCEQFNDFSNMFEECVKYTIPKKIFRNGILDLDAINEQENRYGDYVEAKTESAAPGTPFSDNFFEETPVEPSSAMVQVMGEIAGPQLQFLTGQLAPIMGASDEHNETAKGISILRDQALGLMSLIWGPFIQFYGEMQVLAVKCAARHRPEEAYTALVPVPGKTDKHEQISVDIQDLQGNITTAPVMDANFPESWTQKSNRFMSIFQTGAKNPLVMKWLAHPDNQELAKRYAGLDELEIPDVDARKKQIEEIARLSQSAPVPPSPEEVQAAVEQELQKITAALTQAAAGGAAVPPIPTEKISALTQQLTKKFTQSLTKSSIQVEDSDDDPAEIAECLRWVNGDAGQKAKYSEDEMVQQGYQNVQLHRREHEAQLKQKGLAVQAGAPPAQNQSGAAAA